MIATFGGGCFWCTEACFKELMGVNSVFPGYAGGKIENPTYKQVCEGNTEHVEVIRIEYDESIITFSKLLEVFFSIHNPTQLNRQGNDVGSQYRSVIFYHSEEQKQFAETAINSLSQNNVWDTPIVTAIEPINNYFPAENYHKDYLDYNPGNAYCQAIVRPKLEKFKKAFQELLK